MLEFLLVFAIGVAVLLAVQSLDIECEQPRRPARRRLVKQPKPPLHAVRATR